MTNRATRCARRLNWKSLRPALTSAYHRIWRYTQSASRWKASSAPLDDLLRSLAGSLGRSPKSTGVIRAASGELGDSNLARNRFAMTLGEKAHDRAATPARQKALGGGGPSPAAPANWRRHHPRAAGALAAANISPLPGGQPRRPVGRPRRSFDQRRSQAPVALLRPVVSGLAPRSRIFIMHISIKLTRASLVGRRPRQRCLESSVRLPPPQGL